MHCRMSYTLIARCHTVILFERAPEIWSWVFPVTFRCMASAFRLGRLAGRSLVFLGGGPFREGFFYFFFSQLAGFVRLSHVLRALLAGVSRIGWRGDPIVHVGVYLLFFIFFSSVCAWVWVCVYVCLGGGGGGRSGVIVSVWVCLCVSMCTVASPRPSVLLAAVAQLMF